MIHWTALGGKNGGRDATTFHVGAELTAATKGNVGKHVEVRFGDKELAFLVYLLAMYYPELVRAAAGALDEDYAYSPGSGGRLSAHGMGRRVSEAIAGAQLERES